MQKAVLQVHNQIIFLMWLICWVIPVQADDGSLTICINYHCDTQQQVTLNNKEWRQVVQPFTEKANSAQQERQQISKSIALFETIIGRYTPTHADLAENQGEDQPGQLDCISESRNTEHYLRWLQQKNKLNWHTVDQRIKRTPFLFDAHWSAVIAEKQTNQQFVVDSWFYNNGEPPIIQPVKQWLSKQTVDNTVIP